VSPEITIDRPHVGVLEQEPAVVDLVHFDERPQRDPVLMGHEHMAQCSERDAGEHELSRHAVAAIDDAGRAVHDDDLGRRRPRAPRARAAACAEQDQPRRALLARQRRGQ
jgi:hypothetical protein